MFIVWGSKKQREHLGKMSMKCPHCDVTRSFTVYEISSRFTLYFIPTFSYARKQIAFCGSCGYISKIPKGMESQVLARIRKGIPEPADAERRMAVLARTLRSDPNNELAWLSMADLVDPTSQKQECFEKVLEINPGNIQAKNSLARLNAGENQASLPLVKKAKNNAVNEGGWGKFLGILLFVVIGLASIFFISEISSMIGGGKDPHVWQSEKWGYEITFPKDWKSIKRDNYKVMGEGVDVFCENARGFSTAVFIDENLASYVLSQIEEGIMGGYTGTEYGDVEKISSREYTKNGTTYRKFAFRLATFTHHYVLVEHNSYIYAISSSAPSDSYEEAEEDFDAIIASLKFLD